MGHKLPSNWQLLRNRREYSHAASGRLGPRSAHHFCPASSREGWTPITWKTRPQSGTGEIRELWSSAPFMSGTLGLLSPDPDAVARAIAAQSGYRLQPTPARAANVLGLSSQVPAQIVYLIDGSSRKIMVGNQIIHFKHAGPRALLGAGTPAAVALQAIRAFGPDHLTADVIQQLRQSLPSDA